MVTGIATEIRVRLLIPDPTDGDRLWHARDVKQGRVSRARVVGTTCCLNIAHRRNGQDTRSIEGLDGDPDFFRRLKLSASEAGQELDRDDIRTDGHGIVRRTEGRALVARALEGPRERAQRGARGHSRDLAAPFEGPFRWVQGRIPDNGARREGPVVPADVAAPAWVSRDGVRISVLVQVVPTEVVVEEAVLVLVYSVRKNPLRMC